MLLVIRVAQASVMFARITRLPMVAGWDGRWVDGVYGKTSAETRHDFLLAVHVDENGITQPG